MDNRKNMYYYVIMCVGVQRQQLYVPNIQCRWILKTFLLGSLIFLEIHFVLEWEVILVTYIYLDTFMYVVYKDMYTYIHIYSNTIYTIKV